MCLILIVLMSIAALFKSYSSNEDSVEIKGSFYKQIKYFLLVLLLVDLVRGVSFSVILPNSYSALDGDFIIQVLQQNSTPSSGVAYMNLLRLNGSEKHLLKRIKLAPDIQQNNVTHITFGCQHFLYGGDYQLLIVDDIYDNNSTQELTQYENFHVEWPKVELNLSEVYIPTYPDEDLLVRMLFPTAACRKRKLSTADMPELWLEVLYCGQHTTCDSNITTFHVLYTEQVKYLQNKVLFNLSCDLFGMAGQYAIQVKSISTNEKKILAESYIHADWNEKFVLNVIDRSIIPCDPYDGIGTLFEYPKCINFKMRDRIRVYGRLREDVVAMNPPTTLEYVAEHQIQENQHAQYFDCELFSERYVEHCFAYVTQAIFGAVAEIRVDCVPTYPVTDMDHGGWSPWSDWTPCSTTCSGGQTHRYRFCDSPYPRYGGKYCEGASIETKQCSNENADKWECLYGVNPEQFFDTAGNGSINLNTTTISECKCGCVADFSSIDELIVIALSSKSCLDHKLSWLIKSYSMRRLKLAIDFVALPCPGQHLKIRDGKSKNSDLLADYEGITVNRSKYIISTGPMLLVEYFLEVNALRNENSFCNARFLARSMQIEIRNETFDRANEEMEIKELALIQIVSFTFAAFVVTMSALLVVHFIIKYRKYEIAINTEYYSPAHTPQNSTRSLQNLGDGSPPSRAISTTTLLSEVVYYVKMRHKNDMKHKRLRESVISEKSHRFSNPNYLNKLEEKNIVPATSHSTQTINKVITPVTVHVDSSSIASFPGYKSKPTKTEMNCSVTVAQINPSLTCATLKNCIEDKHMDSGSSKKSDAEDDIEKTKVSVNDVEVNDILNPGSNATLTSGCYSTPTRTINTATIRATNQKERKEMQNLEKLLSRPQSEFSLGTNEDFEMDYYDYNVLNAADVPGSYLGMDPAYLVWIPPLEQESAFDNCDSNSDNKQCTNDVTLPRHESIDTGSNQESPSPIGEATISPTPSLLATQKIIENACHISKNFYQGMVIGEDDGSQTPPLNTIDKSTLRSNKDAENEEKETTVIKSTCKGLHSFYDEEDIQFVDD